MQPTENHSEDHASTPPLLRDRAFWGLNLTQFLGAFNDNLYKQLVMLLCVENKLGGHDMQGLGVVLFAWPFIAFSGFAGYLSDRYSKRTIVVLCKLAEVVIVLLGFVGFVANSLPMLLAVLCLMGVHSAFFGPSKYGLLPELLRPSDLPKANGIVLMATFLAIIFGMSAAGAVKHAFGTSLWLASLPCLLVAVAGVFTSRMIRPTAIAHPNLTFEWSSFAVAAETRKTLRVNPSLLGVILMVSVFWFVGGTVYPSVTNAFGKTQLMLNDLSTGIMAASTGLGIAIGCMTAGVLSKDRVRGWLVSLGASGLVACLAMLALPGPGFNIVRDEVSAARHENKPIVKYSRPSGDLTAEQIGELLSLRISMTLKDQSIETALDAISTEVGIRFECDWSALREEDPSLLKRKGDQTANFEFKKESLKAILDKFFQPMKAAYGTGMNSLSIGTTAHPPKQSAAVDKAYQVATFHRGSWLGPNGSIVALIGVGFFAGFFSVPLQVYLQAVSPKDQRGRILGACNLGNWIGIAGSGIVYWIGSILFVHWLELPVASLFGFSALLILPVALFYRPPTIDRLSHDAAVVESDGE